MEEGGTQETTPYSERTQSESDTIFRKAAARRPRHTHMESYRKPPIREGRGLGGKLRRTQIMHAIIACRSNQRAAP